MSHSNIDSPSSFEHTPLGTETDALRLVAIEPCFRSTDQIACTLLDSRLSENDGYTALSYMWGDAADGDDEIVLNGKSFFVRRNLWNFLHHARDVLDGRLFWIDSICINQNKVQERNHQVRIMGQIYANANRVIAWLGTGDFELRALFDLMQSRERSRKLSVNYAESIRYGSDLRKEQFRYRSLLAKMEHLRCIPPVVIPLLILPYWKRAWVVQEVLLAKSLSFMCGSKMLDCDIFLDIFAQPDRYSVPDSDEELAVSKLKRWYKASKSSRAELPLSLRLLLHRTNPLSATRELSSNEMLDIMLDTECKDPRDHIFSLLSIVKNGRNFPIDYAQSRATLTLQVLQRFGGDLETLMLTRNSIDATNEDLYKTACSHMRRFYRDQSLQGSRIAPIVVFEVGDCDSAWQRSGVHSSQWRDPVKEGIEYGHRWLCLSCLGLPNKCLRLSPEADQMNLTHPLVRMKETDLVLESYSSRKDLAPSQKYIPKELIHQVRRLNSMVADLERWIEDKSSRLEDSNAWIPQQVLQKYKEGQKYSEDLLSDVPVSEEETSGPCWRKELRFKGMVACCCAEEGIFRYAMTIDTLVALLLGDQHADLLAQEATSQDSEPEWIDITAANSIFLGRFSRASNVETKAGELVD